MRRPEPSAGCCTGVAGRAARSARVLVLALSLCAAAGPTESLQLSSDLRVVVLRGRDVALEVRVRTGDDYEALGRRVCADDVRSDALSAWNRGAPIAAGQWVRVPLQLLSPSYRSLALRSLFPEDRSDGGDWVHLARRGRLPTYDEGLWQVTRWFARDDADFDELRRANGLDAPELRPGQDVRIPAALLHPAFRARPASADGSLSFVSDAAGPYAAYRLLPGEAIYSAVVVRFTGRTAGEDVVALSHEIASRSGIPDLRDIPAGFEIKIPLDLLEPEFLPADDPRRIEAEARAAALAQELASHPVATSRTGLSGVLLIVDPGHGGRDMGTMHNGVWEHDYVYDVACRLRRLVETETTARVALTLEDRETGCAPSTLDRLVANRQGTILTSPPFLATADGDAEIGVNLRWYLANSLFRKAVAARVDPDRVVFLSLHADSRHPSLRGAMVYVPGAAFRAKTYGYASATYRKYSEVREDPFVRFSERDRVRSEAVSRRLAGALVAALGAEGLPVQAYQPVRDKIVRGRERWVPAVLRGNAVPTKVLVEIVNIANSADAELLGSAAVRERMARGLLQGLRRHFGEAAGAPAAMTAAP